MRITNLCYIQRGNSYLMLNRNKKALDENAGKWIGVGGHVEENESPDECIVREVLEETGLHLSSFRLRGVITFILPDWGNELTFLYTGSAEGEVNPNCAEGALQWVPVDRVPALPLWEGDRVFLPLLQTRQDCFSLKLVYASGGALLRGILDGRDVALGGEKPPDKQQEKRGCLKSGSIY